MEKNYYDEILEKMQEEIKNGNLEEAYRLVVNELSLPYVPEAYLNSFISIKEYLVNEFKKDSSKAPKFSVEELFEIIEGNELSLVEYALKTIEQTPLVKHTDRVQKLFDNSTLTNEVKALVYETCCEQKIDYDFKINNHTFNPKKIGSVSAQEEYEPLFNQLTEKIGKDQTMMQVAYFIGNKYLIINFDTFLRKELDLEVVEAIYELTLLFLNRLKEQDLSPKALAIMSQFK